MAHEDTVWDLIDDLADRVYLQHTPLNPTMPYILIHSGPSEHGHEIGQLSNVFRGIFQIDCVSRDASEALTLLESVRNRLDAYTDENVIYSMILDEEDLSRPPESAEEQWLYVRSARYSINLHE